MLSRVNDDIKFHIFEFLNGKDLIVLDIAVINKKELIKMYKFLTDTQICDKCIDYFKQNNLKISKLEIKNINSLSKLKNLEIKDLYINIDYNEIIVDNELSIPIDNMFLSQMVNKITNQ